MTIEAKIIAFLILLVALFAGGWYLHHKGYEEAKSECRKDIAIANEAAEKKLSAANARVAIDQESLNAQQDKIIQLSEKLDANQSEFNDLRTQYANDIKRLSVRAYRPGGAAKQGNNPTVATGTSEITVQLVPAFSTAILYFARGYIENLRLKNECIDLYNAARDAVNKPTT